MRSLLVLLLIVLCSVRGSAQDSDKTAALERQVYQLERRIARLEAYVRSLPQPEPSPELKKMMGYAQLRMALDNKTFSREELNHIEKLYQSAAQDLGTPASRKLLETVVSEFPKSNRAGCSQLYIARYYTSGEERERILKDCIARFGDCYYGDGTQVAPFALFTLARYYAEAGKPEKAKDLYSQIRKDYSDAVEHTGLLLVSLIE